MNIDRCLSLYTLWSEYCIYHSFWYCVCWSKTSKLHLLLHVFVVLQRISLRRHFAMHKYLFIIRTTVINSKDTVRKNLDLKVHSCNNPQTKALIRSGSFRFSGLSHWSWTLQDGCFPLWSASPWAATLAVLQIYPIILWDMMAGTSRWGEQASPRKAICFMV